MRTPTDNPIDPLGNLGAPVRPAAPAPVPPPSQPFTAGDWAPKGLVITPDPAPAVPANPNAPAFDDYTLQILGCI